MKLIMTLILSLFSLSTYSQQVEIYPVKINCDKNESGIYLDYCLYDLVHYTLLVGFNTNNLKALIKSKKSENVEFVYDQTNSDAMTIKPAFFESSDKKIVVIMLELAAEYSWGQKIVLIMNDQVSDCGFLDYMTNENNGESIAKYAIIKIVNNQIVLTFQPQEFVDKDEIIVNSSNLKYLLSKEGIKLIK